MIGDCAFQRFDDMNFGGVVDFVCLWFELIRRKKLKIMIKIDVKMHISMIDHNLLFNFDWNECQDFEHIIREW